NCKGLDRPVLFCLNEGFFDRCRGAQDSAQGLLSEALVGTSSLIAGRAGAEAVMHLLALALSSGVLEVQIPGDALARLLLAGLRVDVGVTRALDGFGVVLRVVGLGHLRHSLSEVP